MHTLTVTRAHTYAMPRYVRLVLPGIHVAEDATDPCADARAISSAAPGGPLGDVDSYGIRRLRIRLSLPGTYVVCHAYKTLLTALPEALEQFTNQVNLSISVAFAVESVRPPLVMMNQLVTLAVPGAAVGDFVKLVQLRPSRGCIGAAASLDGGQLSQAGELTFRVVDESLLTSSTVYVLCHAFNYTKGVADVDYHTQADLNVTVTYPVHSVATLDVDANIVRPTVRKRLSIRVPFDGESRAIAGDAVVLLPASVGQCVGAAALHKAAACEPEDGSDDGGDLTAATTLELPLSETGNGPHGVESRPIRLNPGEHVICHAFASDIYVADSSSALLSSGGGGGGSSGGDGLDNTGGVPGLAPSPPPPVRPTRCVLEEDHVITDSLFRMQYGVTVNVEYPVFSFSPTLTTVSEGQRITVGGGTAGDMLRWLPVCELGCGNGASHPDFPFRQLGADPAISSPPPPDHPAPPNAPGEPALPGHPPSPYLGPVSVPSSLPAATYKGCYAYAEDIADFGGGTWPDMQYVVEIPPVCKRPLNPLRPYHAHTMCTCRAIDAS